MISGGVGRPQRLQGTERAEAREASPSSPTRPELIELLKYIATSPAHVLLRKAARSLVDAMAGTVPANRQLMVNRAPNNGPYLVEGPQQDQLLSLGLVRGPAKGVSGLGVQYRNSDMAAPQALHLIASERDGAFQRVAPGDFASMLQLGHRAVTELPGQHPPSRPTYDEPAEPNSRAQNPVRRLIHQLWVAANRGALPVGSSRPTRNG